eukprot:403338912
MNGANNLNQLQPANQVQLNPALLHSHQEVLDQYSQQYAAQQIMLNQLSGFQDPLTSRLDSSDPQSQVSGYSAQGIMQQQQRMRKESSNTAIMGGPQQILTSHGLVIHLQQPQQQTILDQLQGQVSSFPHQIQTSSQTQSQIQHQMTQNLQNLMPIQPQQSHPSLQQVLEPFASQIYSYSGKSEILSRSVSNKNSFCTDDSQTAHNFHNLTNFQQDQQQSMFTRQSTTKTAKNVANSNNNGGAGLKTLKENQIESDEEIELFEKELDEIQIPKLTFDQFTQIQNSCILTLDLHSADSHHTSPTVSEQSSSDESDGNSILNASLHSFNLGSVISTSNSPFIPSNTVSLETRYGATVQSHLRLLPTLRIHNKFNSSTRHSKFNSTGVTCQYIDIVAIVDNSAYFITSKSDSLTNCEYTVANVTIVTDQSFLRQQQNDLQAQNQAAAALAQQQQQQQQFIQMQQNLQQQHQIIGMQQMHQAQVQNQHQLVQGNSPNSHHSHHHPSHPAEQHDQQILNIQNQQNLQHHDPNMEHNVQLSHLYLNRQINRHMLNPLYKLKSHKFETQNSFHRTASPSPMFFLPGNLSALKPPPGFENIQQQFQHNSGKKPSQNPSSSNLNQSLLKSPQSVMMEPPFILRSDSQNQHPNYYNAYTSFFGEQVQTKKSELDEQLKKTTQHLEKKLIEQLEMQKLLEDHKPVNPGETDQDEDEEEEEDLDALSIKSDTQSQIDEEFSGLPENNKEDDEDHKSLLVSNFGNSSSSQNKQKSCSNHNSEHNLLKQQVYQQKTELYNKLKEQLNQIKNEMFSVAESPQNFMNPFKQDPSKYLEKILSLVTIFNEVDSQNSLAKLKTKYDKTKMTLEKGSLLSNSSLSPENLAYSLQPLLNEQPLCQKQIKPETSEKSIQCEPIRQDPVIQQNVQSLPSSQRPNQAQLRVPPRPINFQKSDSAQLLEEEKNDEVRQDFCKKITEQQIEIENLRDYIKQRSKEESQKRYEDKQKYDSDLLVMKKSIEELNLKNEQTLKEKDVELRLMKDHILRLDPDYFNRSLFANPDRIKECLDCKKRDQKILDLENRAKELTDYIKKNKDVKSSTALFQNQITPEEPQSQSNVQTQQVQVTILSVDLLSKLEILLDVLSIKFEANIRQDYKTMIQEMRLVLEQKNDENPQELKKQSFQQQNSINKPLEEIKEEANDDEQSSSSRNLFSKQYQSIPTIKDSVNDIIEYLKSESNQNQDQKSAENEFFTKLQLDEILSQNFKDQLKISRKDRQQVHQVIVEVEKLMYQMNSLFITEQMCLEQIRTLSTDEYQATNNGNQKIFQTQSNNHQSHLERRIYLNGQHRELFSLALETYLQLPLKLKPIFDKMKSLESFVGKIYKNDSTILLILTKKKNQRKQDWKVREGLRSQMMRKIQCRIKYNNLMKSQFKQIQLIMLFRNIQGAAVQIIVEDLVLALLKAIENLNKWSVHRVVIFQAIITFQARTQYNSRQNRLQTTKKLEFWTMDYLLCNGFSNSKIKLQMSLIKTFRLLKTNFKILSCKAQFRTRSNK